MSYGADDVEVAVLIEATVVLQGTPEWRALRLGKATGSRICDVVAKGKAGAPSASRKNYLAELVVERLTGVEIEGFKSAAMERGNEVEAEARDAYAWRTGNEVEQVGFVDHPTIPMAGASPDGLVAPGGCVEFKCPNTATHIETLQGKPISGAYMTQMQWEMACTGNLWCDFVSYDNRMPPSMRLKIVRVPRDPERIAELEREVRIFLAEVENTVNALRTTYEPEMVLAQVAAE